MPAAQAADTSQAAVKLGWGPVTSGDEFNYTGKPDSTKWGVYNSAGHAGKGTRTPSAIKVANGAVTITGNSQGVTGGMSARFGKHKYGRYEVRMRTSANEPQYHAVALLWPDKSSSRCWEIDYAEHTGSADKISFFLHHGCPGGTQTYGKKVVNLKQWNNYAVEWSPTAVKGYINGQLWFTDTNPNHIPNVSMHQTLQLDWFPKSGVPTKPATMDVDWVRVYSISAKSPYGAVSTPTFKSAKEIAAVDSAGTLWNYHDLRSARTKVGTGWNVMESVHVTDWNGDGVTDLLAKAKTGALYLYKGRSTGGFSRVTLGSAGWQNYAIDVAKWKKLDTKPSIIAKHKSNGELFAYPNPNGGAPGTRVKFGTGWSAYALNLLDWDKDGSMDILGKTPSGAIKLYRTNGYGAFVNESRKIIGGGWNGFGSVTAVRGFQGSSTDGLLARNSSGQLFHYRTGTSTWAPRAHVGGGWNGYTIAGN